MYNIAAAYADPDAHLGLGYKDRESTITLADKLLSTDSVPTESSSHSPTPIDTIATVMRHDWSSVQTSEHRWHAGNVRGGQNCISSSACEHNIIQHPTPFLPRNTPFVGMLRWREMPLAFPTEYMPEETAASAIKALEALCKHITVELNVHIPQCAFLTQLKNFVRGI